jgi:hypothetical protein
MGAAESKPTDISDATPSTTSTTNKASNTTSTSKTNTRKKITNANVLATGATKSNANSPWGTKYEGLLLDDITKAKFKTLSDLIRHNNMNDIHHITGYLAKVMKVNSPVLLQLSKMYQNMIDTVSKYKPELQTLEDRFKFLADDKHVLEYFVAAVDDKGPAWQSLLTGREGADVVKELATMLSSMRMREAKAMFFQFKYAQISLFQAAFANCMWDIGAIFVDQTLAFHKARETVFKNVYRQLFAITEKYTGQSTLNMDDIDEIRKMQEKAENAKKVLEIREKLEKQRLTSLKDVFELLLKSDEDGGLARDYGKLLPLLRGKGALKGMVIGNDGNPRGFVDNFVPTYWTSINEMKEKIDTLAKSDSNEDKLIAKSKMDQLKRLVDAYKKTATNSGVAELFSSASSKGLGLGTGTPGLTKKTGLGLGTGTPGLTKKTGNNKKKGNKKNGRNKRNRN